jgi:hypothetical protein
MNEREKVIDLNRQCGEVLSPGHRHPMDPERRRKLEPVLRCTKCGEATRVVARVHTR